MTTGPNPDQHAAKLAQVIRAAMDETGTPAYKDRLRFIAVDARARYLSFVAAGFSAQEALALTIGKP